MYAMGGSRCGHAIHRPDEPVSATREGFHKSGAFGRVTEGTAELVDGCVETFIKAPKRIRGPNRLPQFLPRHDFPGVLQQQRQNPQWLLLQSDPRPVLAQLTGAEINFEHAEPDDSSPGDFHEISYGHATLTYRGVQSHVRHRSDAAVIIRPSTV